MDLVILGVGFPDIVQTIEDINHIKKSINFLGFLDDNSKLMNEEVLGYPVIGNLEWINSNLDVEVFNTIARNLSTRNKINEIFVNKGAIFANLIHPTVSVNYSKLGKGILLSKNIYLEPRTDIGSHTMILQGSSIGHDCKIGKNCFVGPGCNILGNVIIEDNCYIGSGTTIYPEVIIRRNTTTGINSIIMSSTNEFETIFSPPSKRIFSKK